MNSPLPYIRDPRTSSLGGPLTKHDVLTTIRKRWTPLYKAIVADAVRQQLLSPEEACSHFNTTAAELKRWVELLETKGISGLKASFRSDIVVSRKLEEAMPYQDERLFIDFATRVVRIDGAMAHLTPYQLRFLSLLIAHAPYPVGREEVYTFLYGDKQRQPEWKILDVMVCKLRRALGEAAIETMWGRGWRWNGLASTPKETPAPPSVLSF